MRLLIYPMFLAGTFFFSLHLLAQPTDYQAVTNQLLQMDELDQRYRNQLDEINEKYGPDSDELSKCYRLMKEADSSNWVQLKAILQSYGWLSVDEVGEQANTTIFMVIQHSGPEVWKKYYPMMRKAVKQGRAKASQLAMLQDRMRIWKGRPQRYGSQLGQISSGGEYYVVPLRQPARLEKRRDKMGMIKMNDYLAIWGMKWDLKQYKQNLPMIRKERKRTVFFK